MCDKCSLTQNTTNTFCKKTVSKAQKTQIVHKMPKSNIKFQNVLKKATKKRKLATFLTFLTEQRKILQRFYPRRIFFTSILLARWYVFTSLRQTRTQVILRTRMKIPKNMLVACRPSKSDFFCVG